MSNKQIRQVGFSKLVHKRLTEKNPELAEKIKYEDLIYILDIMFGILGELLRDGYRVIFEGHFSYFTHPVKRKCTNLHTNEEWWTFKRRVRTKPMDKLKGVAEVDMTEEEYQEFMEEAKSKKKKTSTGN